MKGRIIGREGRNIRAFESVTGVNLIIDDTPEAVLLSCFDPVRREIGRITLEKLVLDGRIHPHRIEEVYERSKDEVEDLCLRAGEDALVEVGITDLHPELVTAARPAALPHLATGRTCSSTWSRPRTSPAIMAAELGIEPTRDQARRVPARHRQGADPRGRGQPRARSAPSWPASTARARTSRTRSRRTTTRWRRARSRPCSPRPRTPAPAAARAPAGSPWSPTCKRLERIEEIAVRQARRRAGLRHAGRPRGAGDGAAGRGRRPRPRRCSPARSPSRSRTS